MPVFKVNHDNNYTVISNNIVRDTNLSLKAKGMMLIVLSLPEDWEFSIAGMVTICKEGKSSIQSIFKELEENHYLKRNEIRESGKFLDIEYNFYETPYTEKPYTEKPYTENPYTVNPDTVNPYTENQSQLNKDRKNKEIKNKDISTTTTKEEKVVEFEKDFSEENCDSKNPTAVGNNIILEKPKSNNTTTPLPPANLDEYIDNLPYSELLKKDLKKWYQCIDKNMTAKTLTTTLNALIDRTEGDLEFTERCIDFINRNRMYSYKGLFIPQKLAAEREQKKAQHRANEEWHSRQLTNEDIAAMKERIRTGAEGVAFF